MYKMNSILIILLATVFFGCATLEGDWKKAQKFDTLHSYQNFLKKYPKSKFGKLAEEKLEMKQWEISKNKGTPESYLNYISEYPDGQFVEQAKKNIEPATFKQAQKKDTIASFEEFIAKYPENPNVEKAKERIDELKGLEKIEAEFFKKYNKLQTYGEIENLIESYSQYKFILKAVSKIEDRIIKDIQKNGIGNRFVVKPKVNYWGHYVRNTIWAKPAKQNKKEATISAGPEFPGDTDGLITLLDAPNWGINSIIRFGNDSIGFNISRYSFYGQGNKLNRLTFVLINNEGFVYVRGKGVVTMPDKKRVRLGY